VGVAPTSEQFFVDEFHRDGMAAQPADGQPT
jgi:hypothetical protein